jgi:asparagine synthase (glutamine-hydrolysing)
MNHAKTSFVVANGEIYNHKELKADLEIDENDLVTQSDSEVIIHGYKKLGNGICNKLIGMFGFVLIAENGDVLACRDKVGVKPLYMGKSKDGKEVLFASELKGIVDQCEPEDLMLVPAGHYWTRESGLVDYYQPEWDVDDYSSQFEHAEEGKNPKKKFSTAQDCVEALETAVIRRCMADVEIGLLLSGGLDSSIIGAIMVQPHIKKHLTATGKLKSFAVGQEGSPDILAARAVSKQLGTEHIEAIFTPEMAFEVLDEIVYHAETYEPELIRSCIPNYFLAKNPKRLQSTSKWSSPEKARMNSGRGTFITEIVSKRLNCKKRTAESSRPCSSSTCSALTA